MPTEAEFNQAPNQSRWQVLLVFANNVERELTISKTAIVWYLRNTRTQINFLAEEPVFVPTPRPERPPFRGQPPREPEPPLVLPPFETPSTVGPTPPPPELPTPTAPTGPAMAGGLTDRLPEKIIAGGIIVAALIGLKGK